MGGKTQLLAEILERLPEPISADHRITSYVEVFVGGGAVFFYLKNNFEIEQAVLFDANPELMLVFEVVQQAVDDLIVKLAKLAVQYLPLEDSDRKKMFYDIRT
ncbi:DNA adenine methylase, partial [bacterium]|nr:DNA adenine methylase [bacterium]